MAWTYHQQSGILEDPQDQQVAIGYAGKGEGKNNPAMQHVKGVGPIPCGRWTIGPVYNHPHLGVMVMNLDPVGHDALGRTLFRIHGDNGRGTASRGCICLHRPYRIMIAASKDKELVVV